MMGEHNAAHPKCIFCWANQKTAVEKTVHLIWKLVGVLHCRMWENKVGDSEESVIGPPYKCLNLQTQLAKTCLRNDPFEDGSCVYFLILRVEMHLKKKLLTGAEQHPKLSLYSKNNTGLYTHTHTYTFTFSCGLRGSQSPHAVQLGHISPKTTFCKWKHCPVPIHPFTKLKHYILWDSSGTRREALWLTWSRSLNDQLAGKWLLFLSQLTFILMSITFFPGSL